MTRSSITIMFNNTCAYGLRERNLLQYNLGPRGIMVHLKFTRLLLILSKVANAWDIVLEILFPKIIFSIS